MPTFQEIFKRRFESRKLSNPKLKHGQEHTLDEFITKLEILGDPEILDQFQALLWRACLYDNRAQFLGDELMKKYAGNKELVRKTGDEETTA